VISGSHRDFEDMKVGGKRRLLIPYRMAYGEAGSGPIPPKAEVRKDMETARNGFLGSDAERVNKPTTNRGILTALDTSIAEQLGQPPPTRMQTIKSANMPTSCTMPKSSERACRDYSRY
jgi:hypothetical protein